MSKIPNKWLRWLLRFSAFSHYNYIALKLNLVNKLGGFLYKTSLLNNNDKSCLGEGWRNIKKKFRPNANICLSISAKEISFAEIDKLTLMAQVSKQSWHDRSKDNVRCHKLNFCYIKQFPFLIVYDYLYNIQK